MIDLKLAEPRKRAPECLPGLHCQGDNTAGICSKIGMKVAINYQIGRKFIRLQVTDESQDIKCMKVSKVPLKDNAITGSFGFRNWIR